MIAPPHDRPELIGAFVAQHWCLTPPFSLALRTEAAALARTLAALPSSGWGSLASRAAEAPVAAVLRHRAPHARKEGSILSTYHARVGGFVQPQVAPVQPVGAATREQLAAAGYMQGALFEAANSQPRVRDDSSARSALTHGTAPTRAADASGDISSAVGPQQPSAPNNSADHRDAAPLAKLALHDADLALSARDVLLSNESMLRPFVAWCAATLPAEACATAPPPRKRTRAALKATALAEALRRLERGLDFSIADVEGRAVAAWEGLHCGEEGSRALAAIWRDLAALSHVRTCSEQNHRLRFLPWHDLIASCLLEMDLLAYAPTARVVQ